MSVVRKLMLITSPSAPLINTQSPTRKGRSNSTVTAPNTFAILSFAASASARPVMPSPATIVVKSKLSASAMKIEPKTTIQNLMTLSTAPINVLSAPSSSSSSSQYSTTAWTMMVSRSAHIIMAISITTCAREGSQNPTYEGIKATSLVLRAALHCHSIAAPIAVPNALLESCSASFATGLFSHNALNNFGIVIMARNLNLKTKMINPRRTTSVPTLNPNISLLQFGTSSTILSMFLRT